MENSKIEKEKRLSELCENNPELKVFLEQFPKNKKAFINNTFNEQLLNLTFKAWQLNKKETK